MIEIIEKNLGTHVDVEQGDQYMYKCPVCHHKNNRLSVNYNKNVFKCWTCGFSGKSVINILYYLESPYSDIEKIKEYFGHKDMYEGNSKLSKTQYDIYRTLDGDKNKNNVPKIERPKFWVPLSKPRDIFQKRAYNYLLSRGMTRYEIKFYNIQYDEDRGSIDIPSLDKNMNLNYYVKHYYLDSYYQNPDHVSKMKIIFNEYTLDFRQPIIITEGFYDAMSIGSNATPILGKFVPKPLIQNMIMYETPFVYLFMDGDAHKEVVKLSNYLFYLGIDNKIVNTPNGEDPNSMGRKKIFELLSGSKRGDFQGKIKMMMESNE